MWYIVVYSGIYAYKSFDWVKQKNSVMEDLHSKF